MEALLSALERGQWGEKLAKEAHVALQKGCASTELTTLEICAAVAFRDDDDDNESRLGFHF